MKYLCSICALADADTITAIEGFTGVVRARPVCWPCCSPVPEPRYYEPTDLGEPRYGRGNGSAIERVAAVINRLGEATTQDVAIALGIELRLDSMTAEERRPYNALIAVLKRAADSGAVRWRWRIPGAPNAGRIYGRAA